MARQMLIDATHPEETRVVVASGTRLEEFDYETSDRKQLKGNIYLAKVTRVEPSLQAAFVDYGGNRHGFLPFSEIHPDYYRIPIADRQALIAEEAALRGEPAEDDAEDDGESDSAASNGNGGNGANGANGDARAPRRAAAEGNGADQSAGTGELEEVEVETRVETVGGDEIEENASKRARSPRRYKIQEVIKRRQVLLVQVAKEERGTKGAALTTYLSLAGRYCVLMPNTNKGGGISRKIGNVSDRRRLKKIISDLEIQEGMAVIVRTAGSQRSKAEIRRDYQYLLRLWDEIRENTMQSNAPCLIYEEANLIKRAIRDLYSRDMEQIMVSGEEGYKIAKSFMKSLMPSHARNVHAYKEDGVPLFQRYRIERQLDNMHSNTVELRSGGYIVINPTEALVAIDVNSGRATRERHIEETALKTNLEAAEEVARQLRLRDLAGLIVIDFIDMEESRHNRDVERRLKDAMRNDRARIQLGRISPFGLLEMSRQRLRPSLFESSMVACPHCGGRGFVRSIESSAFHILRALEEEGVRRQGGTIVIAAPVAVALNLLNQKRNRLIDIEQRYDLRIEVVQNDALVAPDFELKRYGPSGEVERSAARGPEPAEADKAEDGRKRRRRRRRKDGEAEDQAERRAAPDEAEEEPEEEAAEAADEALAAEDEDDEEARKPRRRRGKRGGRRRSRRRKELSDEQLDEAGDNGDDAEEADDGDAAEAEAAGAESDSAEASDQPAASEAKPKRRPRRRSTAKSKKADEENEADGSAEPGEADDEAAEGAPKSRRRGRTSRRRQTRSETSSGGADKAGDESEPETAIEAPAEEQAFAANPAIDQGELAGGAVAASSDGPAFETPASGGSEIDRSEPEIEDSDKPKRKGWWSRFI